MIHDIGKKDCSNLAGTNMANYTYFVLHGFNWIIDSLLTDYQIKFCLITYSICIPFLLSTRSNKNEKQAGAELGKAWNKLNRASHNR